MYYFEPDKRKEMLQKELLAWVGTPYRHQCRIKQVGADCIGLVAGVFSEIGVPYNAKDFPKYPKDYHFHNSKEVLSVEIPKRVNVEQITERTTFMDGDILLYKFGKISSHAGVYCNGYVFQSVSRHSVAKIRVQDRLWYPRLTFVFRILD